MAVLHSIQQRGFRKWYERELLIGHSHLVLLLLSTVTLLGAMEAFMQPGGERWLMAACVVVATGIGLWALRRYLFLLSRAEMIANQAVCTQCKAYARWVVEAPSAASTAVPSAKRPPADDDEEQSAHMVVCCRGCGGRWLIEW